MTDYRGYVTQAGHNYEAVAKTFGYPVKIGVIEIGDGVLADDQSPVARTKLVNKIREFPAKIWQDEDNPGQWVAECAIPADDHHLNQGYFIREMGCKLVEQGAGVLYAYRRVSNDFKPLIATGEAKSFIYRMKFIPSSEAVIHATVDPTIVWVTQTELNSRLSAHINDPHAHPEIMRAVNDAQLGLNTHVNDPHAHPTIVTVINPENNVTGFGHYLFTAPGVLTLSADAPEGSSVIVAADHSVNLSLGDCLISAPVGELIQAEQGPVNQCRLVVVNQEFRFIRINGEWRV